MAVDLLRVGEVAADASPENPCLVFGTKAGHNRRRDEAPGQRQSMLIEINGAFRELSHRLQSATHQFKILICTGNRPYALAMASLFALQYDAENLQLLGIATTEEESLETLAKSDGPVLAFVSEILEDGDGIRLAAKLKEYTTETGLTSSILTLQDMNPRSMQRAVEGPSDVVLTRRGIDLIGVINAVEAIRSKERYIDPVIAYTLERQSLEGRAELSERELSVLELVCNGLSNREIGQDLQIAETTARGHVQAIIRKLHVRDRTAAAAEAIRRHLIH